MVFLRATESFCPGSGGRGGGLFVTCPRFRGPRPSMRRRHEIAAGRSFVGKLGTGTITACFTCCGPTCRDTARWRDSAAKRNPRPLRAPVPDGGRDAKETRATVQSHPVRRVVSGALAAASVITLVTLAQPTA